MAELNRNFIGGKMNIDLDDRLIQPGIYRRGQNISVSTSDGADVGALESIRGNRQIQPPDNYQLNAEVFILGSTVDRLNDKVYYYFVGNQTEGVYELDVSLNEEGVPKDEISRLIEFSIARQTLNFNVNNLITGSAVIGDLLVWTDGRNPIRKINIERFRGSGNFYLPSDDKDNGQDQYLIRDVVANATEVFTYTASNPPVESDLQFTLEDTRAKEVTGVLQGNDQIGYVYDELTRVVTLNNIPEEGDGTEITVNFITVLTYASPKSKKGVTNAILLSDTNPEYDKEENAFVDLSNSRFNEIPADTVPEKGLNAPEDQIAFPTDLINLGKRPPLQAPRWIKVENSEKVTPNNSLEESFVYFAYRYVYRDGEVTPLSPFSEPAFFPGPYSLNDTQGTITSFKNTIQEVDIMFDPGSDEVVEVEIWLTKGLGRPIKSLVSLNKKNERIASSTPYNREEGMFTYNNNKTYRTLPTDQANYIFSDIPITAKALEFVGNRLVLGNYVRNYSLTKINEDGDAITPEYSLSIDDDRSDFTAGTSAAAKSLKADREYEVGVVYLDREGRQSSVIISKNNRTEVEWKRHNLKTQLKLEIKSAAPYWATHYRVFYKDVTGTFENIFPKTVVINDAGDRLYAQLLRSDINKIGPDTRLTYKGNHKGVENLVRREFRVDPYSSLVGEDGGFRLEQNLDGTVTLDSSTAAQQFFVPFDVVAEQTGEAFTTAWNKTEDFKIPYTRTDGPTVITPPFAERFENIVINNIILPLGGGAVPQSADVDGQGYQSVLWTWNEKNQEIHVTTAYYAYINNRLALISMPDLAELTLNASYTDREAENPESQYEFVALAPKEVGDLAPFIPATDSTVQDLLDNVADELGYTGTQRQAYFDAYYKLEAENKRLGIPVFGEVDDNNGAIFETVDDDIGALEDSLYFEWGQTFRCVNGAHTTAQGDIVMEYDKIQEIYAQKATGLSVAINQETLLDLTQISTDLETGTYDVYWTDVLRDGVMVERNSKGITYERLSNSQGQITFLIPTTVDSNVIFTFTDAIPEDKEIGDAYDNERGSITIPLTYYNVFSYPSGVEEVKIGGTFNAERMSPGIRASVVNESYRRREQIAHLIHSGIFNDDISLNRLNEFNRNNQIEWELEINSGSIQKLHARDTNLVVFQENKVKNVPINKNLIQTAGGQLSTTRSNNFFNTERSYDGEFGISRNPESFATYGSRMYFSDKDRGALLRLSQNGITEISQAGTEAYVRSTLSQADLIICSYDDNRDQAHFSFRRRPEQPSATNIFFGEFILSTGACPDPRAECNIVQDPEGLRGVVDIPSMRVYSSQEVTLESEFPLFGLKVGDALFADPKRSPGTGLTGDYRYYLLFHESRGTIGLDDYIPANNYAIQVSPDGIVTDVEENCQDNRPSDLPRQLFGISEETFGTPQDACANGVVEGRAYHNGSGNRPPEQGETIYGGRYDIDPLFISGYKLVIGENFVKYVVKIVNGLVTEVPYECNVLELGRTPILGSHPILIPFGTLPADRNLELCSAPFAEEVYWFDAESQLPELGDELFDNNANQHLVFGPWDTDIDYVPLADGGQYVSYNDIIWSKQEDTLSTTISTGTQYKIVSITSQDWTSVGGTTTEVVGNVFTATADADAAALALLGTVTIHAVPSITNPNWTGVSGYVYITFENGYFCAIGHDGKIITYGNCSEVRCFSNPDDLIISNGGTYDFTFPGIKAEYTVSTRGTDTTVLEQFTSIRGAELNYVVEGNGRYPASGSFQVNAENTGGDVFYSPIFDTAAPRETTNGADVYTLYLEEGSTFTLPDPTADPFMLSQEQKDVYNREDPADLSVRITSLCYRGAAFNSTGDPLDLIPNPPSIDSITALPSAAVEVANEIVLTALASDIDGTIVSYKWDSVNAMGEVVDLDSNLTVSSGTVNDSVIGITAATAANVYTLRLTVTDSNIISTIRDITIVFNNVGEVGPTVEIQDNGVSSESIIVARDTIVQLTTNVTPDGSETITEWTWSPGDNVRVTNAAGDALTPAEITAATTGMSASVPDLFITSNSTLPSQYIGLLVTASGGGIGADTIGVQWAVAGDDGRFIRQVFLTDTAISGGANLDQACKNTGTNAVYYDAQVTPIKYYIGTSLEPGQIFQGGGNTWGASINVNTSVQGGAPIDFIQTIDNDGLIAEQVPVVCAAPYGPFNFGYIEEGANNNATYVTACETRTTEAYLDQPITNFSGVSEENRAKVIYTRKGDGTLSAAPNGFWVGGDPDLFIVPSTSGILRDEPVEFGCSRSRTFTADAEASNVEVNATDGSDTVNIGETFNATCSISPISGKVFSATPTWVATNGGQVMETGSGTSYTYSGQAGTTGDTRDVAFTAFTEDGVTTLTATLSATSPANTGVSFDGSGSGSSSRVTEKVGSGGFNMTAYISPSSGRSFSATPTYTLSGARSGSGSGTSYNYFGNIGSSSEAATVTWNYAPTVVTPPSYTATLTTRENPNNANVSIVYSGINLGSNSYRAQDGTGYNITATVTAASGWELASGSSPANLSGTFNGANVNPSSVDLSGTAVRPSFSTVGQGSTAASACSGGGTLYGVSGGQLWDGSTGTSNRAAIYYRIGNTIYYWNGSSTSSQSSAGVCALPDRPSIGACGFDDSDTGNACDASTSTYYGSAGATSLANTTGIFTAAAAGSSAASSGFYAQSGSTREWNGSSLGSASSCPSTSGTITASVTGSTNVTAVAQTNGVTITVGGDATGFLTVKESTTPSDWSVNGLSTLSTAGTYSITISSNPNSFPRGGKWTFYENADSRNSASITITQAGA